MRARFFSCFLTAAACSGSTELGSVQQAICNCNQDPVPCCCNSPILVDVAGNGFELTTLDDGVRVATRPGYQQTERAWTQPGSDDAWLVMDRNGDGVINDMSEMFGNTTPQADPPEGQRRNGFLALALDDDNADAVIDERDPIFGSLRLWQDENHDGVSQPDELHSLPELGVAGISVTYTEARRGDGNGNLFLYRASVYGTPGSKVGTDAWDVWLSGVQSMPVPGGDKVAALSSPLSAATRSATDYWTCEAECTAVERGCAPDVYIGYGSGDLPPYAAAAAFQNCHDAIPYPMYCPFDPSRDRVIDCQPSTHSESLWTCSVQCDPKRNDVPAECEGHPWFTRNNRSRDVAQRSAIAACTSAANAGFCKLADDPNDTTADSPDNEIDNVTVTCQFHPSGGGGGGGGCE